MEFRILGPLEVLENGRQIDLGGAKQRSLLAVFLLDANRVVSTKRIIDSLWDDSPPEQARKALQVYVSQLRKALGKGRIVTRDPGYLLRVEAGALDLDRFLELRARGDLEEAVRLFRGEPLADFEGEPFAEAEIARLRELRLATVEDRIDADLAAARHGALVGELERFVAEHPLRERLRAQLMLALYRSGRQAEALEAFQDARRALVDELGIEPSRPLRDLQRAILAQNPELELATPVELVSEKRPDDPPPASPEPHARSERKTVTVVRVLLSVTSAEGQSLDPEVLERVLTRALREIAAAIRAHEGTIDALAGDSVTGVFGLPVVHEDDPARATRAAEEAVDRLGGLALELEGDSSVRLEARIGVSTGAVLTGTAGSPVRATGEPLTLAARLAQEAGPGEVRVDEATGRATAARRDGSRFMSPMVGRQRERRRLRDVFEQAASDRSCQLFTILGSAGVGKSRLVQEFLADLDERALVARGRCLPYGEGITFWPVLEAIRELVDLDHADTAEQAPSRLAALLEGLDDAELVTQRVAAVAGLAEGAAGIEEGFDAVRAFFEGLAARQPLVVVFDDIHWGEETFLDLVEHIADWSRGAPILLLCMARPELLDVRPSWGGGKLNSTSALLEPLSDDECTELVANLIGEDELAEEVEARIAGAAEGNPLFVEEMLSMLIDEGLLVRRTGRWVAVGDLGTFAVPPTIQALLAARLDQLSVDERAVVEPAAVEGMVFSEGSAAQLASSANVSAALSALVRKELIRPERPVLAGERAFRFRHLLIRDAAYDSIPKESRAVMHERHAEWLEEKTGGRSIEFDEIVGYHLEQAVRYRMELGLANDETRPLGRQAAERLGTAGRRAFVRSDAPAGTKLISRAVALLSPEDPLRVELVPNVRTIQGLSDLTWAERVLTEAVEVAATTGDRTLAAHALVQRGFLHLFTDSDVTPQELYDLSQRTIDVFEELEDYLGQARAWRLVAQAHYLDRRIAACAEASERALAFARLSGDKFEETEVVEWLVIALLLGPTPAVDAIARCETLLEESTESPPLQASILAGLAHLVAMQGSLEEAIKHMEQSKRIMDESGEWIWIVNFWWGYVFVWQNDPETAERELRPGYEALKKIGERSHFSSIAHELSHVVYALGRYDEAEALTRECEEATRPNDVHSQILWRAIRGKVFARRGEFEEAERLVREAIELAETSDLVPAHADALADLAEVLELAGRPDDAAEAVGSAIALYERKGNLLASGACRKRLAGLIEHGSGRA
jgi:DNA-binding SARP family transcriptional activator/tetratricopeptide (TPR) repeat protein